MAKVFVTRKLPGKALDKLAEEHDVEIYQEDHPIPKAELIEAVKDAEVLICLLTDTIDKEVINAGKKLKVIANYAVGYNNVHVDWATLKDVGVLNTPGVLTDASADFAFALLMAASRRVCEADRYLRHNTWDGWAPMQFLGPQITGKTLGLVGMGRIGQVVAKRAQGFEMKILYTNRQQIDMSIERRLGATFVELDELLEKSDFVSLHCPLTPETHHLIGKSAFEKMKSTAILINTSRGPVVDESALVEALKNGEIFGAGLDVFENEPDIHPELKTLENVIMAPHIGSASLETREGMVNILVTGIQRFLRGNPPPNLLNPEVL